MEGSSQLGRCKKYLTKRDQRNTLCYTCTIVPQIARRINGRLERYSRKCNPSAQWGEIAIRDENWTLWTTVHIDVHSEVFAAWGRHLRGTALHAARGYGGRARTGGANWLIIFDSLLRVWREIVPGVLSPNNRSFLNYNCKIEK